MRTLDVPTSREDKGMLHVYGFADGSMVLALGNEGDLLYKTAEDGLIPPAEVEACDPFSQRVRLTANVIRFGRGDPGIIQTIIDASGIKL